MNMRKHRGFSLFIVLVLGIIAMLFVGAAVSITDDSSGSGRASVRSIDTYNVLQSEVERARSALKAEMSSRKDAIKCGLSDKDAINSIEDLEVLKDGVPFWRVDYKKKFRGAAGDVSVRMYDMQYFPANVAAGTAAADLPPSVKLEGTAEDDSDEPAEPGASGSAGGGPSPIAGVYLIRAVVTFGNGITHKIDASVIQNSNPKA
jgi:hypothetical protein